ncbi:MAG: hypothetical protein GQE15_25525 [Archangiaceae bacterium]|nr:hypothetical protein [Archangiaceae bacterium]
MNPLINATLITTDGQSIASFRWTQRSGPAITISANQAAALVHGPRR